MFDKSKIDDRFLREGEDGQRWSQEAIDNVEAILDMDIMDRAGGVTQVQAEAEQQEEEEEGKTSTTVTPQKPETP